MDEQKAFKKNSTVDNMEDKLFICPNCQKPAIRVGCHAICKHCGYQEGCGD